MPEFNRRQLFKLRIGDLSREVGKIVAPRPADTDDRDSERFPRPPGALRDEAQFLATCERCHACAGACPHGAIDQFGPAHGRLEGTPFINPGAAPCHWCEEMPCIAACPSDALIHDPELPVPPIAKVSLDLDKCLNRQGILCDTCSFRCPTHIKAIRMVNRMPQLDAEACTGCGMCLFHCDAEPTAFGLEFIGGVTAC
jgi:ferredoxin-type protein NapG